MSFAKNLLPKLGISFFSLFFCFFILEIATRLFLPPPQTIVAKDLRKTMPSQAPQFIETHTAPDLNLYVETPTGIRLKSNIRAIIRSHYLSRKDIELTTNSLGYRYEELGPKTPQEVRILVLGDSITLADYVPYHQTYTYYMEKYLNDSEQAGDTKSFKVINAGVGTIGLDTELAILLETGLSTQPDLVILALYLNDAYDSSYIYLSKVPKLVQKSFFLTHLYQTLAVRWPKNAPDKVSRSLSQAFETEKEQQTFLKTHALSSADWKSAEKGLNSLIVKNFSDWGFAWSDSYWNKVEETLKTMKEVAQNNNFKLAVILLPVKYQVQSDYLSNEPQQQFSALMKRLQLPHLDLLPPLRQKYQEDKADVFFDHCHYKNEGNEFIGKEIGQFLEKIFIEPKEFGRHE